VDELMSESERWEEVKRWLRENGLWIVAGVGLGVLGLTAWQWWQARTERLAIEAGSRYQQVLDAFGRGDRTRAFTLIDELRRDHPDSAYRDQAELAAARAYVDDKDLEKAAERLRFVMGDTEDRELALIARLRLARVQIAQNRVDDALATLQVEDAGAFTPRYHEVRGDALHAKGDRAGALKEYQAARAAAVAAVVDTALLDLKINDLLPPGRPRAPADPKSAANPARPST
jgi:predicted negative regulator of RcsB-dependent stress response